MFAFKEVHSSESEPEVKLRYSTSNFGSRSANDNSSYQDNNISIDIPSESRQSIISTMTRNDQNSSLVASRDSLSV